MTREKESCALIWRFDDNKLVGFEPVPKVTVEAKFLGVCISPAGSKYSGESVFIDEGMELDAAVLAAAEGAAKM